MDHAVARDGGDFVGGEILDHDRVRTDVEETHSSLYVPIEPITEAFASA